MRSRLTPSRPLLAAAILGPLFTSGCSIKGLAIGGLSGALAGAGESFASDEDPELVRDALPFALKTYEALLVEAPENRDLLLGCASGFTQYAYAFIESDAERIEEDDWEESERLRGRARKMYLRARDYGLRGLALEHPELPQALPSNPDACAECEVDDIDFLFWTAAAWGSAISVGLDHPELVADVEVVRSLLARALELDEDYADGAIHAAYIGIESLPEVMGGSPARAREHFDRALELTRGQNAGPYVALAKGVALPAQDRGEFERLLEAALAVDPDVVPSLRLENLLAQDRARRLLLSADDLFLEPLE